MNADVDGVVVLGRISRVQFAVLWMRALKAVYVVSVMRLPVYCPLSPPADKARLAYVPLKAEGNAESLVLDAEATHAPSVLKLVRELFGDWQGDALPEVPFQGPLAIASHHLQIEAAQEQIVAAWPSARFGEPLYYAAKVYNEILSGGMFGRLFIEVREKRGLCYSVMCRHSSARAFGTMFAYAGTTPERAHETLEVTLRELRRLPGTVESEELNRAKGNLKASLVMNQESSGSRANANAYDWWLGKRVRSLDEISQAIDAVTADQIDSVGRTYPPDPVFTLTLGSRDLRSAGGKL